jgi:hypothetical protein
MVQGLDRLWVVGIIRGGSSVDYSLILGAIALILE